LVSVERVAPFGDPIEVKIKGYSLTLRKEEAARIQVEPL
jgi:ferrous iron transport protein A